MFEESYETEAAQIPAGSPCAPKVGSTPASTNARRIASKLFRIGVFRPASKSRTVLTPTLARCAKSAWEMSSQPRAARH